MEAINADRLKRAVVDTNRAPWLASPSQGVWRRPLEREDAESGLATSIVRYDPGADFPSHSHPGGEAILVLQGTFSDEHGDYPAGTWILNPPDSRHRPFSRTGCVLFVKLCQYAGAGRVRKVVKTADREWRRGPEPGLSHAPLYRDERHPERMSIVRLAARASCRPHLHPGGEEILVMEGALVDELGSYPSAVWIRNPHMSEHRPYSPGGCLVFVCRGAMYPKK